MYSLYLQSPLLDISSHKNLLKINLLKSFSALKVSTFSFAVQQLFP